jgi:hypothetical protein
MGSVTCPECFARLKWTAVRFGEPFRCPACGSTLEVPVVYMATAHWVSVIGALTIAYFLSSGIGSRIMVAIFAYWPIVAFVSTLQRLVAPPQPRVHSDGTLGLSSKD